VVLSQPKGAEGSQPPAGAKRFAVLRRTTRAEAATVKYPWHQSGGSGSANCAARQREPIRGDDDARFMRAREVRPRAEKPDGDA
jgi:hypothetical protein